jgi:hypothetical protein
LNCEEIEHGKLDGIIEGLREIFGHP